MEALPPALPTSAVELAVLAERFGADADAQDVLETIRRPSTIGLDINPLPLNSR